MSDERKEAKGFLKKAYEFQMGGQLDLAIEYYKKSIEIFPTAEAHTFLGWTYSFMGRYGEAVEECERAIEIDPDFGNPYNDIGAYLIEMGRFDEAIPWLEKAKHARRYEPRYFPYFNLARIYKERWQLREAIAELEKALEIEPNYETARKELKKLISGMN